MTHGGHLRCIRRRICSRDIRTSCKKQQGPSTKFMQRIFPVMYLYPPIQSPTFDHLFAVFSKTKPYHFVQAGSGSFDTCPNCKFTVVAFCDPRILTLSFAIAFRGGYVRVARNTLLVARRCGSISIVPLADLRNGDPSNLMPRS